MKTRLQKSIEYLSNYCDKHSCDGCRLHKKNVCLVREWTPCDWLDKLDEKKEENNE